MYCPHLLTQVSLLRVQVLCKDLSSNLLTSIGFGPHLAAKN